MEHESNKYLVFLYVSLISPMALNMDIKCPVSRCIGNMSGMLCKRLVAGLSTSAEVDFYRHRVIVEQEAVRAARECLLQQKKDLEARQSILRTNNNTSTMQQLQQVIFCYSLYLFYQYYYCTVHKS